MDRKNKDKAMQLGNYATSSKDEQNNMVLECIYTTGNWKYTLIANQALRSLFR